MKPYLTLYSLVENLSFSFVGMLRVKFLFQNFFAKKVISISLLDTVTSNTKIFLNRPVRENYVASAK